MRLGLNVKFRFRWSECEVPVQTEFVVKDAATKVKSDRNQKFTDLAADGHS